MNYLIKIINKIINKKDYKELLNRELSNLWDEVKKIPLYENNGDEKIAKDFYIWKKGESLVEIAHWFDAKNHKINGGRSIRGWIQ